MKQFRDPLFLRRPSPSISEKFFHDPPPLYPNFKKQEHPPPNFRGAGNYVMCCNVIFVTLCWFLPSAVRRNWEI